MERCRHSCLPCASDLKQVVLIAAWEAGTVAVIHAIEDGYRPVIVPDDIAHALHGLTDLDGNPMLDLGAFREQWNESFSYTFIEPADLTEAERTVFDLRVPLCRLAGIRLSACGVKAIRISENMRLGDKDGQIIGVYEPNDGLVVIRRDQLATIEDFCGTLLHELEHAASGFGDGTLLYEQALTQRLGLIASKSLQAKR